MLIGISDRVWLVDLGFAIMTHFVNVVFFTKNLLLYFFCWIDPIRSKDNNADGSVDDSSQNIFFFHYLFPSEILGFVHKWRWRGYQVLCIDKTSPCVKTETKLKTNVFSFYEINEIQSIRTKMCVDGVRRKYEYCVA